MVFDSGAADAVTRSLLRCLGKRGAPVAMLLSGFLLAIPVFFDTVFFLLVPLAKSIAVQTGGSYSVVMITWVHYLLGEGFRRRPRVSQGH